MNLPPIGLEDIVDNEDFYSLLNSSREATEEELRTSYRRLCMIYHPDKQEDAKHKEASDIFGRIQTAYNVLSNQTTRHIYDVYGKKGLEADWQVVERYKTPQEFQAEYERIQRLRAQHRLDEVTHPEGTFSVTVNATSLFDDQFSRGEDEYYEQAFAIPEITKMSLSQSVQAPLTVTQTATLSGNLESVNGNGSGNLNVALRKSLSAQSWGELEVGATDSRSVNLGVKSYRALGNGLFAIVHVPAAFTYDGMTLAVSLPGANFTAGRVMSEGVYTSLDLATGSKSHLAANVVCESARARLVGKVQLGIPHSYGLCSATYKIPQENTRLKVAVKGGTFGLMVEYGAEHQVSEHSVVSAHISVGVPLGVSVTLKLNRASQTYVMPIMLSDEVDLMAAFYGTLAPFALYAALHVLVVRPYRRREKERQDLENEELSSNEICRKRAEAMSLIEMMRSSAERKAEAEDRRKGLVIVEAVYGRFVSETSSRSAKVIDVKVPVQCLVEDSKLQLPHDITKSGLPGFFDPSPSSDKKLKITYKFRDVLHQVTIDDRAALRMPLRSHVVEESKQSAN